MDEKKVLEKAEVEFIQARSGLLVKHPFYASLALRLQLQWSKERSGGLSSTDGRFIYADPEAYLNKLNSATRATNITHEALHCALGDLSRRGTRDPQLWNLAADIWIDNILETDGFDVNYCGPQGREGLLRNGGQNRHNFRNQTKEEIYSTLEKLFPPEQGGCGGICDGHGSGEPGEEDAQGCMRPANGGSSQAQVDAGWKAAVIEAAIHAGNTPGAWNEIVKAVKPKRNWIQVVNEFLMRGVGADLTFSPPNRRHIHSGLYLPSETTEVMGEWAVAVDTSGSMSSNQLAKAIGIVAQHHNQHGGILHWIWCDYDIPAGVGYQKYEEGESLPEDMKVPGRGGTSFNAPFKLLREKQIEPQLMIYLTDGEGSCEETKPTFPVLWVILPHNYHKGEDWFKPPFGEVIYVSE